MPIDFQTVRRQVKAFGKQSQSERAQLKERLNTASNYLSDYSDKLNKLNGKVEQVASQDAKLRCAMPVSEALNASFPAPPLPEKATLIAVDGSQIFASRHNALEYSLINIGAIHIYLGSPDAPKRSATSELRYGLAPDARVSQERDLREREELEKLAADAPRPVLTFTDGPLELWRSQSEQDIFTQSLKKYLGSLAELQKMKAATAGYVDKPIENLVVRLLEIATQPPEKASERPLAGVRDQHLYRNILKPGERSAVFAIRSDTTEHYEGELELHFFYLNVGREGSHWLARVEIPGWVANDKTMLDSIHAVLVDQSRAMGSRPFPYILHRAHEEARVSMDEKDQLELLLRNETGIFSGESHKQFAKNHSTAKTRYSA